MDRQSSYARTRERLEEIVTQVKAKDMSLEKSLDLYEEALRLGNVCAEMIDRTDFSAEELEDVRADNEADEADETDEGAVADEVVAGAAGDATDDLDTADAPADASFDPAVPDEVDEAVDAEEQA
jgi:exodeoxyribonuclease VII small subunit